MNDGEGAGPTPRIAVDTDILVKASCYDSARLFWPETLRIGVLGAARYVVPDAIRRKGPLRGAPSALADFETLMLRASELEPTEPELDLAIELETAAARTHLRLDAGESQLAAIVASRALDEFETGDKRGIAALDGVLNDVPGIAVLVAKVRCLEQLVRTVISTDEGLAALNVSVCSEPGVDAALTFCFACASGGGRSRIEVFEGIDSFTAALRRAAPRVLARY